MKSLTKTLAVLGMASLVGLGSSCGRERISQIRDVNGDGLPDVVFSDDRFHLTKIEIGKKDGTSEAFDAKSDGKICYLENKKGDAYFFNGTNFQFAPAWEKINWEQDKISYIPLEAQK